jgi:hypothetical protein
MGPRICLDAVAKKKIPAHVGNRIPIFQAVVWSLYWLSYRLSVEANFWGKWLVKYLEDIRLKSLVQSWRRQLFWVP